MASPTQSNGRCRTMPSPAAAVSLRPSACRPGVASWQLSVPGREPQTMRIRGSSADTAHAAIASLDQLQMAFAQLGPVSTALQLTTYGAVVTSPGAPSSASCSMAQTPAGCSCGAARPGQSGRSGDAVRSLRSTGSGHQGCAASIWPGSSRQRSRRRCAWHRSALRRLLGAEAASGAGRCASTRTRTAKHGPDQSGGSSNAARYEDTVMHVLKKWLASLLSSSPIPIILVTDRHRTDVCLLSLTQMSDCHDGCRAAQVPS